MLGFIHSKFARFSKLFSRKNLYKLMSESVNNYCKSKNLKILSIGSGGDIKKLLDEKGLKFKEVDIDPKRKPDYVMPMEDMCEIKSNSIDRIFCMEVLEHVNNPFEAISEAFRVLKKGGIFIGSSPFVFPIHDAPYDHFRYTRYGLRLLFKKFKCLKLVERNSYIESSFVIWMRLVNIGTPKEKIIGALLFPFFILFWPFLWLISKFVTNYEATTGYFYIFKKF